MTAATELTDIFPRNRVLTTLMVVNTLLFVLCGIINLTLDRAFLSMIWFCAAVLIYLNFLWSKKTAFIQFTEEGLVMFPAMARPKRQIKWSAIASLHKQSENKVYLILTDGERVKITLFSVNKEDRVPLLRRLDTEVASKSED